MKIFWNIIGGVLILVGGLFFLQGIDILGGSLMSGQTQWAVIGGLAILAGAGLLLYVNRNRPQTP